MSNDPQLDRVAAEYAVVLKAVGEFIGRIVPHRQTPEELARMMLAELANHNPPILWTSPPEERIIAKVSGACGRYFLNVAGVAVAMEGDPCRDGDMPENILPPIPEEELEYATIGGQPIKDMPIDIVRFFRGDKWNKAMLEYVAGKINEAAQ